MVNFLSFSKKIGFFGIKSSVQPFFFVVLFKLNFAKIAVFVNAAHRVTIISQMQ